MLSIFNDYKIYEVPNRFSYQHLLLIFIDIIYIFSMIYFLRNKSKKTQKIVLLSLNIACALIFAGRMFFGWEGSRIYNEGSKTSLLPFELCNLNIFISLIALIIDKKFLNNYLYFVSMIGALVPLLVFPDIHMITNGNNLFHYMFFDYWFIHTQLVLIPLAMISWKWFKPNFKIIPYVSLTLFGVHLFCFLSSALLRNFPSFSTANYMYTMSHNNLPVLRNLYSIIPFPYLYELPLIIPIVGLFILMTLPFKIKKGGKENVK